MQSLSRQLETGLRNSLLVLGAMFLVLVTCLGLLLRLTVTEPLGRLGRVIAEIVRTGRYEQPLPERGNDEIGRLINGFNEMMAQIQENTEQLEESDRRFRALTETARDGIVTFLAKGQIILFNREAERLFGYSKAEAFGISVAELVHESCRELHEGGVEAYLEQHAERLLREIRTIPCRRRDGSPLDLELTLSAAESDGHRFYTAILRAKS